MKSIVSILFLFIFSINLSFACVNDHKDVLKAEGVLEKGLDDKAWKNKINKSALEKLAAELLDDYSQKNMVEDLSDYAVALIYLGDFIKAKNIYHQIETEHPGLYTTASNLGTIYELTGKPDSALIWIQKSIDINPYSHGGSEWIHIKILEFKIKGKEDYSTSILGLDFGQKNRPKSQLNDVKLAKLQDHIEHQLKERGNFVKPKNLIVGSLYNDLGDIMLLQKKLDEAEEMYSHAKEYGFESDLMNQRIDYILNPPQRSLIAQYPWILIIVGLLLGLGINGLLRRRAKN